MLTFATECGIIVAQRQKEAFNMTFKKFEELFLNEYPNGEVVAHGKFGGTENNNKVAVVFDADKSRKVYEYYGSYQTILNRLGIKVLYKGDVEQAKRQLAYYKENDGKPNIFSLFNKKPMDYSKEIAEYEQYLSDIENGKYIII